MAASFGEGCPDDRSGCTDLRSGSGAAVSPALELRPDHNLSLSTGNSLLDKLPDRVLAKDTPLEHAVGHGGEAGHLGVRRGDEQPLEQRGRAQGDPAAGAD